MGASFAALTTAMAAVRAEGRESREFFMKLGKQMKELQEEDNLTRIHLIREKKVEQFKENTAEADEEIQQGPGYTYVGLMGKATSGITGAPYQQIRLVGKGPNWKKRFDFLYSDREIRGEVAIKCGQNENTCVRMHAIVLETRSPFLGYLIKTFPADAEDRPLLMFRPAPASVVRHVVKFAYFGETTIYRTNLDEFMDFANFIGMEGIVPREIFPIVRHPNYIP